MEGVGVLPLSKWSSFFSPLAPPPAKLLTLSMKPPPLPLSACFSSVFLSPSPAMPLRKSMVDGGVKVVLVLFGWFDVGWD